jgi:polyisoprenoid-binding protein YceI
LTVQLGTDAPALPAAGTWHLDPSHTSLNFSARHLGVAKVRGQFGIFDGTITLDGQGSGAVVDVRIDAASITTGSAQRDAHLRSPDFLDVENHPTLVFHGTQVEEQDGIYRLTGDLTIRGVSRPVTLDVEYGGLVPNPLAGGNNVSFTAEATIDRRDWGLTWNPALEGGAILVSHKVGIELDVVARDVAPQS